MRENIELFEELYEAGMDDIASYEMDEFDEDYYRSEYTAQWWEYIKQSNTGR